MADDGENAENVEQVAPTQHTIKILLPQSDVKQVQVQASSLETINDIKQSLIDLPSTNHATCFRLEFNGELLNDFIELASIESLPEDPEFKLVETPYTERDSRIHIARLLETLSGGIGSSASGGETNFGHLQVSQDDPIPLAKVADNADASIQTLTVHDTPVVPSCLKSLTLSVWNPAQNGQKNRGHLLYLVFNTLEGDSIHITSTISGFYANNSTASKLDHSRRQACKTYHSLLPLLKALSPLFKRNYASLEKYMTTRNLILTVPITNAHAAEAWMSFAKEHRPDAMRVQRPYLEHGFENNDTLRDWNEELQTTKELPISPLQDRIMRCRLLQKTLHDFSATAAKGAELLVKGELMALNPTEHPDAQMYIYSNIFFSRGLDGVGTFFRDGGDSAAHKAVALDVTGVRILSTLDVDGLSTLGTCVVDYAGQRIVAQSIVPGIFRQRAENESQIIYGGVDGRDVVATDPKCDEIFSKISAALRLRRHPVFEKTDERKELELSIETKGLAGADGRTYVLDLYRITPIDIEFLENECGAANEAEFISVEQSHADEQSTTTTGYPHRMTLLRYEMMEAYWEAKLNDYVKTKMEEEDASNGAEPRTIKSGQHSEDDTTTIPKESEADTSVNSDEYTEIASGGQVAVNGRSSEESTEPEKDASERRVDISGFSLLFNPDTFHARFADGASAEDVKQKELDEALIRDVSQYLRSTVIPKFVEDLREARVATPMDSASLVKVLHKRGINLRYLGKILQLAEADSHSAKYSALIIVGRRDIVSRSSKHILSNLLKGMPFALTTSVISHFLNCLFSPISDVPAVDPELETLYPQYLSYRSLTRAAIQKMIEIEALRRFRYQLPENWQTELTRLPLLREICLQCGYQISARDYFAPAVSANGDIIRKAEASPAEGAKKNRKQRKDITAIEAQPARTSMFVPEDILNILPVIKDSAPRSGLAEEAMEAGRVFIVQGQKDLGSELLTESLSLHEQIYGVLHPEAARGYNNLALIYSSLEERERAVELARKAVVVAERTLGLDNSETILYYLNLALFEHAVGNTKQALRYLEHALAQWRCIFGADHPDMITTINNVAVMLQSLKLYSESLKWFESSVVICESVYGPESLNAATLYFQIAQAMALTGDHKGSINRMRDSHSIFKKEFGEDNHNTKETHLWLTQLTQNAVHLAKQAKIEASKKGRQSGAPQVLPGRGLLQQTPKLQNQNGEHTTVPEERTGSKGMRSIEELVNYISGDDKTQPKKTSKKTAKRGDNP